MSGYKTSADIPETKRAAPIAFLHQHVTNLPHHPLEAVGVQAHLETLTKSYGLYKKLEAGVHDLIILLAKVPHLFKALESSALLIAMAVPKRKVVPS